MAYASKHNTADEGIVPIGSNLFGICTTASATAIKVVSLSAFDVLTEGVTIHVFFQNANTATSPSLQVGSTESKAIRYNGTNGGTWEAGSLVSFTYYNGYWVQNDVQSGGGGGETYTLSINDHTVTLTGSGGSSSSVTVPDDDTKYGLSISGHTVSLVEGGSGTQVTVPDNNTTYSMSISGHTITLTPSSGTAQSVTVPDDNTTYSIGINGHTITLTPSSGTAQSVTVPDDDTTYSISGSGNTVTLTGSDGSTSSATVSGGSTPTDIVDLIYPVGSIYMSTSNANPSTLFPNTTWTQIQDKFLLASGSTYQSGLTGGSPSFAYTPSGTVDGHTLTTSEIPAHTHGSKLANVSWRDNSLHSANSANKISNLSGSTVTRTASGDTQYYVTSNRHSQTNQYDTINLALQHTHDSVGGGDSHDHGFTGTTASIDTMPPYLVVNVWQRTA